MNKKTVGILGAVAVAAAFGVWRATEAPRKHDAPPVVATHLELFLRVRDAAGPQVLTNTLGLVDQMGDRVAVDAYVLSSNNHEEDDRARCAVDQGALKGLRFIQCQLSVGQGNEDWSACAETAKLSKHALEVCTTGAQARTLALRSQDEAARREVSVTPLFFVERKRVQDGTREGLKHALCEAAPEPMDLCAEDAGTRGFPIYVMTDSRCPDCKAPFWFRRMQMLFPQADIVIVDVKTPPGRAQYDAMSPGLLPAIVLDARVDADPGFALVQRQLVKKGDAYLMSPDAVRPSFDPAKAN